MLRESNAGDKDVRRGGSAGPGKEMNPKELSNDQPEPPKRAIPLRTPLSPTEFRKLKEQAKTRR